MISGARIHGLVTLFSLFMITAASAEGSKAHALKSVAAWSAFECAALASISKDTAQQQRLFLFGLDQGRKFIAAYQAGKIKREDLSKTAPLGFLLRLEGPSPDFMLGRIFDAGLENALEDVFNTGETFNSREAQITLARSKFNQLNCQLIGT